MTEPESHEEALDAGSIAEEGPLCRDSLLLFVVLLCFYHANLAFLPVGDAVPNVALPISLLEERNITFTPDEFPGMFRWKLHGAAGRGEAGDGRLELAGSRYYLGKSTRDGEYVNYYGLGAGLTALPVFAVVDFFVEDFAQRVNLALHTGKFVAAMCVAGSAVFVYLAAGLYCKRRSALLIAMAYGLGTGVYSTSSQALWQHGPNELFLALGAYLLLRAREHPRFAAGCGLALGMAVLCRPTSFVFVVFAGIHLMRLGRRPFAHFICGGAVPAAVLGVYHQVYMGAPWRFAQVTDIAVHVQQKTGSANAWPFRWHESIPGLLFSPSRGLFLYSPFIAFSFIGAVRVWRDVRFVDLRPLTLAALATAVIQFSWFDWWGGWSYGYRPLVDLMPYLAILLAPVIEAVWRHRVGLSLFVVTLSWSILVQLLGAFAYHSAWNDRFVYSYSNVANGEPAELFALEDARELLADPAWRFVRQGHCNVDRPECRYRLWSWRESQIVFLLENLPEQVEGRRALSRAQQTWSPDSI